MRAAFYVIDLALALYIWVLIAGAILSWMMALKVVNASNQAIAMIGEFLNLITEPGRAPFATFYPRLVASTSRRSFCS